ncbi:MAG: hypothetical protein AAGC55_05320 [Myxococcota bacterium]
MNDATNGTRPAADRNSVITQSVELVAEAARSLDIAMEVLDPEYGFLYELACGDRRRVCMGNRMPLNDAMSARLAEDKYYSGVVLARRGLPTPTSVRCLSPHSRRNQRFAERTGVEPGLSFATRRGYPVVVKPNRLSMGRGVSVADSEDELRAALRAVWQLDDLALVQNVVPGRDVRLDFLDDRFLVGYERLALDVTGDGRRTLRELLVECDRRAADEATWTRWQDAPAWAAQVTERGLSGDSVVPAGERISLGGPIHNLNQLSTGRLVERVPESLRALCIAAGQALGLRLFGVDLKVDTDGDGDDTLSGEAGAATIIEVNGSPLLLQIGRMGYRDRAVAAQTELLRAVFDLPPGR